MNFVYFHVEQKMITLHVGTHTTVGCSSLVLIDDSYLPLMPCVCVSERVCVRLLSRFPLLGFQVFSTGSFTLFTLLKHSFLNPPSTPHQPTNTRTHTCSPSPPPATSPLFSESTHQRQLEGGVRTCYSTGVRLLELRVCVCVTAL